MTIEISGADRLPPEARERLERIVVEIVGIASECDRTTQQTLRRLADQISILLDDCRFAPR